MFRAPPPRPNVFPPGATELTPAQRRESLHGGVMEHLRPLLMHHTVPREVVLRASKNVGLSEAEIRKMVIGSFRIAAENFLITNRPHGPARVNAKPLSRGFFGGWSWDVAGLRAMGITEDHARSYRNPKQFIDELCQTMFGDLSGVQRRGGGVPQFEQLINSQVQQIMSLRQNASAVPFIGNSSIATAPNNRFDRYESETSLPAADQLTLSDAINFRGRSERISEINPDSLSAAERVLFDNALDAQRALQTRNAAVDQGINNVRSRQEDGWFRRKWREGKIGQKIFRAGVSTAVGLGAFAVVTATAGVGIGAILPAIYARRLASAATAGTFAYLDARKSPETRGRALWQAAKTTALVGTAGIVIGDLISGQHSTLTKGVVSTANFGKGVADTVGLTSAVNKVGSVAGNVARGTIDTFGGYNATDRLMNKGANLIDDASRSIKTGYQSVVKPGIKSVADVINKPFVDPTTTELYDAASKDYIDSMREAQKTSELMTGVNTDISKLNAELGKLNGEIANAKAKLAALPSGGTSLAEIEARTNAINEARRVVTELELKEKSLYSQIGTKQVEYDSLKSKLDRYTGDSGVIAEKKAKFNTLKASLDAERGASSSNGSGGRAGDFATRLVDSAAPTGETAARLGAETDTGTRGRAATAAPDIGAPAFDPRVAGLTNEVGRLKAELAASVAAGDAKAAKILETVTALEDRIAAGEATAIEKEAEFKKQLAKMQTEIDGLKPKPATPPTLRNAPIDPPYVPVQPPIDPRLEKLPKTYVIDGTSGKKSFWNYLQMGGFSEKEIAEGWKNKETLEGVTANLKAMLTDQFYSQQESGKKTLKLTEKGLNKLLNMSPEVFMRHLPEGFKITPEALRVQVEEVLPDDTPATNPTNPLAKRFEYV